MEIDGRYLWRYCLLNIWGIHVSFGCKLSCSSPRRVSNFNSNIPQGGIYPHIKFERDPLNIFRIRAFTSSGSTGGCGGGGCGGDAKTIVPPNTSFGDIINKPDITIDSNNKQTSHQTTDFHHITIETINKCTLSKRKKLFMSTKRI